MPGLEAISWHLLIIWKYSTRGWLFFVGVVSFCLFFNGQIAIRSLQVFGTQYSVMSHLLQVKQESPKRLCSQLEAHSSTASMNISVKYIHGEGTEDFYFPQTSAPLKHHGGRCWECSPANQAGVTHEWIICKNFCIICPTLDCTESIFKVT